MPNQTEQTIFHPRLALLAGWASIVTVTILIVIKSVAWASSGSASVLASLTDSVIDAAISIISFMAIRHSLKPADDDHRYGHGKIEGLMALLQAAFIGAAAIFLIIESVGRLADPRPVSQPVMAIIVMVISTGLSALLVAIQNYSLRRAPSLSV